MNPLYEQIQKNCLVDPTIESCGLVLEAISGLIIEPCKNISEFPRQHFLISSEEQREKEHKGKLIGFYHSHVDTNDFSHLDKAVAEATNLTCFLYKIPTEELLEYKPNGWKAPYLGRPFIPGIFDCSELVRDYYKKELNLSLPRITHEFKYSPSDDMETLKKMGYTDEDHQLTDYFTNNGFKIVPEPALHDVILMRGLHIKCPVHCLIYLGNDKVLHHPSKSNSKTDQYDRVFKKLTSCILRHQSQV